MPQNDGGRYPDSWGDGPQQPQQPQRPQRPQQVFPGQYDGGYPGGYQVPPQPEQPDDGGSRGRRAGFAVLIAVAVLALIGLGAALALLRPWESDDTDASTAGQAELSTVGTTTHGAPSTAASSSKSTTTSSSTRATDVPEGMSRTGFDGGMSCQNGDRWVYAAQASAGEVLICDGGSGLYYLDNFGQGPWRTEVTRHSGDDYFEMTTRATTIYIDGDRLWVDSEGQITRTDDFYEVHTAD
ncbi:hypothetical protein CFRA_09655 [Corynebacterium frankenforstense DSM 45800]|uniref:Uncharacterized protein n=1 Tax=Corynebacterium frankenforstense DSM 45800 TaxID=1437875 RepID=A0A1L7CUE3_9CORY|nr:hypothetical protein [Corynebacterium frankenforstense]APT89465.1 hypothetical protein CFRA_09655 [Corynebacterium frankenforstense DSM 45800]